MACSHSLPVSGFLRDKQIIQHLGIGRSTWWRWVNEGAAPAPIRLGKNTTVWRAEDIRAFVDARMQEASVDC